VVAGGGISGLLLAFLAQNCVSSKLVSSFLECVQLMGVSGVWEYDCGYFSKYFLLRNIIK